MGAAPPRRPIMPHTPPGVNGTDSAPMLPFLACHAVNYLGHFLLTNMLLPLLSTPETASRIVNVSSAAHLFGTCHFDDLMLAAPGAYNPWK
jgi:NAD(P)-dependent dehydrogenase (short-subunit alcohol dehydrogenase family)